MNFRTVYHNYIFKAEIYFPQCHASTIEFLSEDDLAVAWFAGSCEKALDVGIWFSTWAKSQWSEPRLIAKHDGIPCWNPVLFYNGDKLVLFYKAGLEIPQWQTMVKESQDGGNSWSDERELVPGNIGGRGPVKNKCLCLKKGRILAPASIESAVSWDCFIDISDDNGKTWKSSSQIPRRKESFIGLGIIQPTLWEDDQGVVHVFTRSTEGFIYTSQSYDMGETWTEAEKTNLPNNNSGIDLTRLEDGRLVLAYNPVSGNWAARSPIALTISQDNGETWSEPYILEHTPYECNQEKPEFSYPAIISKGNDIFIIYTWKRKTIAFWRINLS